MEQQTLVMKLQQLNELLIEERVAITQLRLEHLKRLQQKKATLLYSISEDESEVDETTQEIAKRIRRNNKRNSWLLRHGLKVVERLRSMNLAKQTLTYNPGGKSLNFDGSPRLLTRRF